MRKTRYPVPADFPTPAQARRFTETGLVRVRIGDWIVEACRYQGGVAIAEVLCPVGQSQGFGREDRWEEAEWLTAFRAAMADARARQLEAEEQLRAIFQV